MNFKYISIERIIFYCLTILYIFIVISLPVFLTQDGPSHLYSSKIINELLKSENYQFYNQFYNLNLAVFPNWLSNIILSLLLLVFKPLFAEKIYIIILIVSLPLSLRYLISKINYNALYLSNFGFIFSFSYFLFYGFYNFLFSLSILLFYFGLFIKYENKFSFKQITILSFVLLLLFFTHPVSLIFAIVFTFVYFIQKVINLYFKKIQEIKIYLIKFIIIIAPTIVLLYIYLSANNSHSDNIFINNFNISNITTLLKFDSFFVFSKYEIVIHKLFSISIFLHLLYLIITKFKQTTSLSLTFFILIIFNLFVYFFISDEFAGGSYINKRVNMMFFVFLLLLLSSFIYNTKYIRNISLLVSFLLPIFLILSRYPSQYKIAQISKDYISCSKMFPRGSKVLSLNYSSKGEMENEILSPQISIFRHIGCYLVSNNNLLIYDNYEANTDYFPLKWKDDKNPYKLISKNIDSGIENNPPSINFTNNLTIDYIIIFGNKNRFKNENSLKEFENQLSKYFNLIFISQNKLVEVYQKNN